MDNLTVCTVTICGFFSAASRVVTCPLLGHEDPTSEQVGVQTRGGPLRAFSYRRRVMVRPTQKAMDVEEGRRILNRYATADLEILLDCRGPGRPWRVTPRHESPVGVC